MEKNIKGIILCLVISIVSWFLGKQFPIIGGAVIAIIMGMIITLFYHNEETNTGINFTSKYILQLAVVLLGLSLIHI